MTGPVILVHFGDSPTTDEINEWMRWLGSRTDGSRLAVLTDDDFDTISHLLAGYRYGHLERARLGQTRLSL